MAQPWQRVALTALAANFVPLLAPANQPSYDTMQFYNNALGIVGGLGAGAVSFRLLPPLSPTFRARRLLALCLRDFRGLLKRPTSWTRGKWEGRGYSRIAALPDEGTPLQRACLLAALLIGTEIIQLRRATRRIGSSAELEAALDALARGDVAHANALLADFDGALVASGRAGTLRARARLLAICGVLTQHAAYFETGEAR
jgi:uncharacterized membrane protein YccC